MDIERRRLALEYAMELRNFRVTFVIPNNLTGPEADEIRRWLDRILAP